MILPIYAGLERIPRRCSRRRRTSAASPSDVLEGDAALAFPAVVAGSIFTFSLTLGDYILPGLIADQQFIGTVIYGDRTTNSRSLRLSRWCR